MAAGDASHHCEEIRAHAVGYRLHHLGRKVVVSLTAFIHEGGVLPLFNNPSDAHVNCAPKQVDLVRAQKLFFISPVHLNLPVKACDSHSFEKVGGLYLSAGSRTPRLLALTSALTTTSRSTDSLEGRARINRGHQPLAFARLVVSFEIEHETIGIVTIPIRVDILVDSQR